MSMVSELIREAPAYKKAVLAVAVTAGVGACVYLGYRQLSGPQTSDKPRGPSKSEEKKPEKKPTSPPEKKPTSPPEKKPTSPTIVREPSTEKEELVVVKPEPGKIDLSETGTLDRSVLTSKKDVRRTASPLRAEELSTSVTFEKINLGPEPDSFEHVSMSQINPLGSSPARKVEEKGQAEEQVTSSSYLTMSQADPSISFISTAEVEQKEEEADKSTTKQTKLQLPEQRQAVGHHETEEAGGSSNDEELASASSVVSIKDENDIVVVETNKEESGLEKSEEERVSPRSGMAAIDISFDSSRVSPVFGQQTYHRVDTEPEELATFDPAKSHPASFGFKFGN